MKVRIEMTLDVDEVALRRRNEQDAADADRNYGFGSFPIDPDLRTWSRSDINRALDCGIATLKAMTVTPGRG